mgnify:CR=1 FL=1
MNDAHDIQLYKPNVSVAATFEVDEKLPDPELTFDLFKKLVLARKTEDYLFLVIGKMLKITRDRKLYKHLDYENFTQFLADENIAFSREKAYMYIRIYEIYKERLQMTDEAVTKIGVAKLNALAPVVKDMTPEQAEQEVKDKKDMRYGEFMREVKQQTNKDGKPNVYWSEEGKNWVVQYYENTTHLVPLGNFKSPKEGEE